MKYEDDQWKSFRVWLFATALAFAFFVQPPLWWSVGPLPGPFTRDVASWSCRGCRNSKQKKQIRTVFNFSTFLLLDHCVARRPPNPRRRRRRTGFCSGFSKDTVNWKVLYHPPHYSFSLQPSSSTQLLLLLLVITTWVGVAVIVARGNFDKKFNFILFHLHFPQYNNKRSGLYATLSAVNPQATGSLLVDTAL